MPRVAKQVSSRKYASHLCPLSINQGAQFLQFILDGAEALGFNCRMIFFQTFEVGQGVRSTLKVIARMPQTTFGKQITMLDSGLC